MQPAQRRNVQPQQHLRVAQQLKAYVLRGHGGQLCLRSRVARPHRGQLVAWRAPLLVITALGNGVGNRAALFSVA
ncbi:hypothetical protein ACIS_00185 [Anaplasma centrale str. Israel]|uniref:Uncharacterized protein n=1 Tax=Anaplasma centrale (strain Israel) TaxID=574556 RepID=D1ATI9_ANACI|nr:hypothetical protein ACIS_00185 [Anaplasma centrale str. Israel]